MRLIGSLFLALGAISFGQNPDLVATLPTDVTVTNAGKVIYRLPLEAPAGVGGMQPELAISYESGAHGGSGVMGAGFSISGLSSITRVGTQLDPDGFIDGVDFDDNDQFSLDGQRLVCIAGTHGADGSEYRSEIESFSRIIAHGNANLQGPEYFEVKTGNGVTMWFGKDRNSAQQLTYSNIDGMAKTGILVWNLDKIEDSLGNKIEFSYTIDADKQQLIEKIEYGFVAGNPTYRVDFEYRAAPYPQVLYTLGQKSIADSLLDRVKCSYVGNAIPVWEYVFDYKPETEKSLTQISRIRSFATGKSAGHIDLEWVNEQFSTDNKWSPTDSGYDNAGFNFEPGWNTHELSDLNGDGLLDVFAHADNGGSYLNKGEGLGWERASQYDAKYAFPFSTNPWRHNIYHKLIDLNGDGLVDVFTDSSSGGSQLNRGESVGWESAPQYDADYRIEARWLSNHLVDLDGDGLVDVFDYDSLVTNPFTGGRRYGSYVNGGEAVGWVDAGGYDSPYDFQGAFETSVAHELVDLNGDGLLDIFAYDGELPSGAMGEPKGSYLNTGSGWARAAAYDSKYLFSPYAYEERDVEIYFDTCVQGYQRHKLVDLNGDGLLDVFAPNPPSPPYYYCRRSYPMEKPQGSWLNTGSGWARASAYDSGRYFRLSLNGNSYPIVLDDLNGDGLVDFQFQASLYLNTGSGWLVNPAAYSLGSFISGYSSSQYEMVDLNSDGLLDVFDSDGPSYLNTGSGWDASTAYGSTSYWFKLSNDPGRNRVKHHFLDLNNDGLLDFFAKDLTGSSITGFQPHVKGSYLNTGSGWDRASDYDSVYEIYRAALAEENLTSPLSDLNGDGLLDDFEFYGYSQSPKRFNRSRVPRLASITNNVGLETRIEYKQLSDISVYRAGRGAQWPVVDIKNIGNKAFVVSSVSKDTGLNAPGGDKIFHITDYTYAEGRQHKEGRGFLGFRIFESYDRQTQISKTEILSQAFPYVGMALSTETRGPNGQLMARTRNTLNAKMLNPYTEIVHGVPETYYHSVFPYFEQSEEWKSEFVPGQIFEEPTRIAHLEATAHGHTLTTNQFDDHGNNIEIGIYYDADNIVSINDNGTPADPSDDFRVYTFNNSSNHQITTNWFSQDDPANWFLGRLTRSEVKSTVPDSAGSGTLMQTRSSAFVYDTSTGLLMEETIEPGHATLEVRTVYTRDSFGNIETTTVHPAGLTPIQTVANSQLDLTKRFFKTTANALGHEATATYYPELGLLKTSTDANGHQTQYLYDALGRPQKTIAPDLTEQTLVYAYDTSVVFNCEPGDTSAPLITSAYRVTTTRTQAPTTTVWFDRRGQEMRAQTESYDGRLIQTDSFFNELGQTTCVSLPHFDAEPPLWQRQRYDLIGRLIEKEAPDGTIEKILYNGRSKTTIKNFVGDGSYTTAAATNENQTRVMQNDARGQVLSETSYDDSNQPLVLTYTHDSFGNLLKTTDPQGNAVAMQYDLRGNRTAMQDPDMGNWSYTYDALGRLVDQTDAKNQTTHFEYDTLSRKTSETWNYTGTIDPAKTAYWHYDGSRWHDALGQLRLEVSPDGHRTSYYYDELGRPFLTLRKIDDQYYYTSLTYDAFSRVKNRTEYWRPNALRDLSDQKHLAWKSYTSQYTYNALGYQTEVSDGNGALWWSDPTYDAQGKLLAYQLGNGLETETSYHPTRQTISSIRTGPIGSATVQALSYTHGRLGNVDSRTDGLALGGSGITEILTYDRLNRIQTASASGQLPRHSSYDGLGNLLTRERLRSDGSVVNMAYSYNGSRPHAVTQVTNTDRANESYGYDASGNITARAKEINGQNIFWNGFNKPATIATSQERVDFSYGAGKNRVSSVHATFDPPLSSYQPTRRQLYAGRLEQEETWNASLNSGAGDWELQRTRVYIGTPAGTLGTWIEEESTAQPAKRNYLHKDHLGSITAITDEAGSIVQRFAYDVWGGRLDPDSWLPLEEAAIAAEADVENALTDRGYTGHEMLDELGLIHMNGRIYDPIIGKMLSADPTVPDPGDLQAYNRYSYVINNPLRYTDPSGFSYGFSFEDGYEYDELLEQIEAQLVFLSLDTDEYSQPEEETLVEGGKSFYGDAAGTALSTSASSGGFNGTLYNRGKGGLSLGRDTSKVLAEKSRHGAHETGSADENIADSQIDKVANEVSNGGQSQQGRGAEVSAAASAGSQSAVKNENFANGAATAAMVHLFNHEEGLKSILGDEKPSEYAEGFQQFGDSLSTEEKRSLMIDTIPDTTDSVFIAALDGASQGSLAYADGFNPFGNPFENAGFYDSSQYGLNYSQWAGVAGYEATLTMGGAGLGRAFSGTLSGSSWFGKGSYLFGRGGQHGMKGVFNSGSFRTGWGWNGSRNVFRSSWSTPSNRSYWNHLDIF